MASGLDDVTPVPAITYERMGWPSVSYSFSGRFNTLQLDVRLNGEPVPFTLSSDKSAIVFGPDVTLKSGDHIDVSWANPVEED